jgi:hypothetical protein
VKVPWRAGGGGTGWIRASVHPGITTPAAGRAAASAPLRTRRGRTRAMTFCAQPNLRLKLTAPRTHEVRFPPAVRCSRIAFVNLSARRRSLGAIR